MAISGKAAEDILERIFQPTTKPSAMDQAEETLRHPKRLVYVAMSNKVFYWRAHIQKFVLDSGMVPVSPFMLFDYYLMHTVSKDVVREAMNNLLARCDEVWVFGRLSLGVKVQVGIAKRMNKPVRYFDISDLPIAIMPISEETHARHKRLWRKPLRGGTAAASGRGRTASRSRARECPCQRSARDMPLRGARSRGAIWRPAHS